jgi:hypothetical protein
MIVMNEAHVMERRLDPVRGYAGQRVIVDTGSSDGRADILRSRLGRPSAHLYDPCTRASPRLRFARL